MEDQIVSFEVAKLAKEKGWRRDKYKLGTWKDAYYILEKYDFYFSGKNVGDLIIDTRGGSYSNHNLIADAPTQSLLQRWLREIHNIHIDIRTNFISNGGYFIYIMKIGGDTLYSENTDKYHKSYEDALEFGLVKALNLI